MYQPILSMQTWLSLPTETKLALRNAFDIPRSGYVEVNDGRVLCDGTMMEDLMYLTTEKMQEYLNSKETDFNLLFNLVVESFKPLPEEPKVHETKTRKQNKKANS